MKVDVISIKLEYNYSITPEVSDKRVNMFLFECLEEIPISGDDQRERNIKKKIARVYRWKIPV